MKSKIYVIVKIKGYYQYGASSHSYDIKNCFPNVNFKTYFKLKELFEDNNIDIHHKYFRTNHEWYYAPPSEENDWLAQYIFEYSKGVEFRKKDLIRKSKGGVGISTNEAINEAVISPVLLRELKLKRILDI